MGPYTLTPATPMQLQNAATVAATGNGGQLILSGQTARVTVVLQSNGTTSGGTVSIEEAYFDPAVLAGKNYTGTWSVIQSVAASTFTGTAQLVVHIPGSVWAIRVRISADITGGGSISAWAYGN